MFGIIPSTPDDSDLTGLRIDVQVLPEDTQSREAVQDVMEVAARLWNNAVTPYFGALQLVPCPPCRRQTSPAVAIAQRISEGIFIAVDCSIEVAVGKMGRVGGRLVSRLAPLVG